ncbi:hypothetical protein ENBRE01_0781 [Enteropsectra breve]|nr:hypothetical protein ENBRE01_0781 [Enteropsectra breve]
MLRDSFIAKKDRLENIPKYIRILREDLWGLLAFMIITSIHTRANAPFTKLAEEKKIYCYDTYLSYSGVFTALYRLVTTHYYIKACALATEFLLTVSITQFSILVVIGLYVLLQNIVRYVSYIVIYKFKEGCLGAWFTARNALIMYILIAMDWYESLRHTAYEVRVPLTNIFSQEALISYGFIFRNLVLICYLMINSMLVKMLSPLNDGNLAFVLYLYVIAVVMFDFQFTVRAVNGVYFCKKHFSYFRYRSVADWAFLALTIKVAALLAPLNLIGAGINELFTATGYPDLIEKRIAFMGYNRVKLFFAFGHLEPYFKASALSNKIYWKLKEIKNEIRTYYIMEEFLAVVVAMCFVYKTFSPYAFYFYRGPSATFLFIGAAIMELEILSTYSIVRFLGDNTNFFDPQIYQKNYFL